jgi:rhodanese-related sulfurtransferase
VVEAIMQHNSLNQAGTEGGMQHSKVSSDIWCVFIFTEVNSKLDKSTKTIVACQSGGTVKPTANLSEGQQSRSLIAAYLLSLDGYKTIVHIDGGLRNWFKDGLPVVYKEEN